MARGTRTHDNQIHNLALYRLNYSHHVATRTIANLLNKVYANVGFLFGCSFFLLETSSRKILFSMIYVLLFAKLYFWATAVTPFQTSFHGDPELNPTSYKYLWGPRDLASLRQCLMGAPFPWDSFFLLEASSCKK